MTDKNIKYYLLTTAAMLVFAAASCFIGGIVQLAIGILISALLGMQTAKYHYGYVFTSASAVFLIPIVIFATVSEGGFGNAVLYAALLTVPTILMGLTLGFAMNLKLSFYKTVVILTVIYLIGSLTNMKVLSASDPAAFDLENIISLSIDQVQATLESSYTSEPELLEIFRSVLGEITSMMITLAPALFTLISLSVGYLCAVLFQSLCMRRGEDMSFWPAFYRLRADGITAILFIAVFLVHSFTPEGLFADALANVIVILTCVFFLYGLSLIDWKLRSGGIKKVQRRMIMIACIPLCTMFFMMPFLVIVILGVADGLLDFRGRLIKNLPHKDEQ